jgi:hypothetical protein
MPRFEELRQPLATILQEDTNSYWLAYQILNRLRERFPEILQRLEEQYGTGYGVGGGHPFRPDNAIAFCLADWPECIDTQFLRGNDLNIGNIIATGNQMGIYRWIGSIT